MSPASTHAKHRAILVERIYAPDPDRCVRAIIALLTGPSAPSPDPSPDVETATAATATASGKEGR